jgi:hypothetical protein
MKSGFSMNRYSVNRCLAGFSAAVLLSVVSASAATAQSEQHGRKYKPMLPTAHIVVTVQKGFNSKPLANAAVIFHAVLNGHEDGNLEVKTDEDGKATIDVIEMGSHLTVQVIANGFATFAQDVEVDTANKEMLVKLQRPRAQISTYEDSGDKAAEVKPGVQEPPHPKKPAAVQPTPVSPTTPPAATSTPQ